MGRAMRTFWRAGVVAVCCLPEGGCYSFRPLTLAPADVPQGSLGGTTRISIRDGGSVTIERGAIVGDSVIGVKQDTNVRVAIPVSRVIGIERWGMNRGRTGALVSLLLIGEIVLVTWLVISFTQLPPIL